MPPLGSISFFIMEGDRFKRHDGFAGLVHGFDLVLESPRGDECADLVVGIDVNWPAGCDRGVNISDPGGVALASNPRDARTNIDIVTAGGEINSGLESQPDII